MTVALMAVPMTELRDQLAAHFAPTDVEWRIGTAGKKDDGSIWAKAFAYITNRAIQDRLDAVVGPGNWKNEFKEWTTGTPGVLCGLSLKLDGEWVTKWDGSEQTDMEALKGGLSGAMKRAAVQWGIGRYLYDLPEGWAKVSDRGQHFAQVKIKVGGQEQKIAFKWDPPDLPKWALPHAVDPEQAQTLTPTPHATSAAGTASQSAASERPAVNGGAYAPTAKQIAYFQQLSDSPVFTEDERKRALDWLATKATLQTIKDQIDWLKRTIDTRKATANV